jgi:hypothetical protein
MIAHKENQGSQHALQFHQLDGEIALFKAIVAKTGRDIFAGVTEPKERQAAARIAILINKLDAEFAGDYQRIYGEPLPERRRISEPKAKGK